MTLYLVKFLSGLPVSWCGSAYNEDDLLIPVHAPISSANIEINIEILRVCLKQECNDPTLLGRVNHG